jgi:hypothetical protein
MNSRNQTIGLLSLTLVVALTLFVALTIQTARASNFNSSPTGISLSSTFVKENVAPNTIVGTLSTADADNGDNFTYDLVAGVGDADNTSFNISGSSLRINSSPNFEAKKSYSIRLRTTDGGGLVYEKIFMISVADINENASSILLTPSSVEAGAAGTFVGALSSNDPDPGAVFYLLTIEGGDSDDDDNSKFTIVDNSSVDGKFYVSLNGTVADDAQVSTYHIRVYYYDGIDQNFEQSLTVSINNANNEASVSTAARHESEEDSIK